MMAICQPLLDYQVQILPAKVSLGSPENVLALESESLDQQRLLEIDFACLDWPRF